MRKILLGVVFCGLLVISAILLRMAFRIEPAQAIQSNANEIDVRAGNSVLLEQGTGIIIGSSSTLNWLPKPSSLTFGSTPEELVRQWPRFCHQTKCVYMEELLTFIARNGRVETDD